MCAAACFFQAFAEPASRLLPTPDRNVVALRGYSLLLHVRDSRATAERLVHSAGKMKFTVVAAALLLLCAVRAEEEDKKEDVGTVVGIDLGTTYSW